MACLSSFRTVTIYGGMHLLQSFLKMMPCSPSLSVWKMVPNDTVRRKKDIQFFLSLQLHPPTSPSVDNTN